MQDERCDFVHRGQREDGQRAARQRRRGVGCHCEDVRVVDVQHTGYGTIGHMGFFRSKVRDALWFPVLNWLLKHRGRT